jgi:hypothetical protein
LGKSLSRLLNEQIEIDKHKQYFCRRCLNYATEEENRLKKTKKSVLVMNHVYQLCPKRRSFIPSFAATTNFLIP